MVFLFAYIARETSRACIEFPGMYGDLQTGFEPIKFLNTRSVRVCHLISRSTDRVSKSLTQLFSTNALALLEQLLTAIV